MLCCAVEELLLWVDVCCCTSTHPPFQYFAARNLAGPKFAAPNSRRDCRWWIVLFGASVFICLFFHFSIFPFSPVFPPIFPSFFFHIMSEGVFWRNTSAKPRHNIKWLPARSLALLLTFLRNVSLFSSVWFSCPINNHVRSSYGAECTLGVSWHT